MYKYYNYYSWLNILMGGPILIPTFGYSVNLILYVLTTQDSYIHLYREVHLTINTFVISKR